MSPKNVLISVCPTVAVHCNTLQHTTTHLPCAATHCNTLQHAATRCNTDLEECFDISVPRSFCALQHTATHCNTPAIYCNTLQHTATHCNALQCTATLTWKNILISVCPACPTAASCRLTITHALACKGFCVLQCVAVCCSQLMIKDGLVFYRSLCVAACGSVLQCAVACCKVLQCVAVCCSIAVIFATTHTFAEVSEKLSESSSLERNIATHCNTPQHTTSHCNTLQHTATHCSTLQHTATHRSTLQHTATYCTALHHTAPHCIKLDHTAPHCNTLQNTATRFSKGSSLLNLQYKISMKLSLENICLRRVGYSRAERRYDTNGGGGGGLANGLRRDLRMRCR